MWRYTELYNYFYAVKETRVLTMSNRFVLDNILDRLREIKNQEGILHISEIKLGGKHPLTHYSEVTDSHKTVSDLPLFLDDDLFFISNDLVHFTSFLYLLRPYINNPPQEDDTYFQNRYDARYLSYASILHSSVYNFWDRIGDLLHCYFQTGLSGGSVYISRVLKNFPNQHKSSQEFSKIESLYDTHVKSLVYERNEDAHNQSIATSQFYKILLARGEEKIEKTELKLKLPDLFKDQIAFAYEGIDLALKLIEKHGTAK